MRLDKNLHEQVHTSNYESMQTVIYLGMSKIRRLSMHKWAEINRKWQGCDGCRKLALQSPMFNQVILLEPLLLSS